MHHVWWDNQVIQWNKAEGGRREWGIGEWRKKKRKWRKKERG